MTDLTAACRLSNQSTHVRAWVRGCLERENYLVFGPNGTYVAWSDSNRDYNYIYRLHGDSARSALTAVGRIKLAALGFEDTYVFVGRTEILNGVSALATTNWPVSFKGF